MAFEIPTQQVYQAVLAIKGFMNANQLSFMGGEIRGEEGDHFRQQFVDLADTITTMPKTYEQDGKGDDAIAYLHYFIGNADWYITEKDMETEQLQAFGLAIIHEAELGYISIAELVENNVMLDAHWTPKTIGEIKAERKKVA